MSANHDRVIDALEIREPDRVPTFDVMTEFSTSNSILGKKPVPLGPLFANQYTAHVLDFILSHFQSQLLGDKAAMEPLAFLGAAAALEMGYDSAWIPYFPAMRIKNTRTVEDIFGRVADMIIDDKGNMGNPIYREGLITSPEAWEAWDKRDIFRMPEKVNRVFAKIQKKYGDDLFIFGFSNYGIFENVWQPMGFERFVVAIRKEKEFIGRLVRFYEDLYCALLEAMADAGLPGALFTEDLCFRSGPMLNPRVINELFGDSHRRITETAHALGMKIVIHSCGDVTDLLEYFADCGFDGVHSLEPTAGVELARAKELVGDRMCLIGNVDVSHTLVDAGREEVFEEVRDSIKIAGPGGGYILSPAHGHPAVSVERLRWMVEAVDKYGYYPIDL